MTDKKTICYFGDFDPNYARNRVLISGLKANGQEVILLRTVGKGIAAKIKLLQEFKASKKKFDLVIVGYSDSRWAVIALRLLFKKLLVWDAFYSLYDAYVYDRQLVKPVSLKAFYYWLMEWLNCRFADKILLDTNAHIDYFVKTFDLPRPKFIKVLIGADDAIFK
ncbi:MAG: hypothetical protein WCV73_00280 [Patescibacteria group bacterium]|jgi:hypothetical protein